MGRSVVKSTNDAAYSVPPASHTIQPAWLDETRTHLGLSSARSAKNEYAKVHVASTSFSMAGSPQNAIAATASAVTTTRAAASSRDGR